MLRIKYFALLTLLAFLASCSIMTNISDSEKSQELIGHGVLNKNVFVCSITLDDRDDESLPVNEIYENHGFEKCQIGNHVAAIVVRKVYSLKPVDHWYLIGSIAHGDKDLPFYYHYGMGYLFEGALFKPEPPPWNIKK
jgi:hypothetical protein